MKHKHRWQFVETYKSPESNRKRWENDDVAEFICECGAVKRVKVKEEI